MAGAENSSQESLLLTFKCRDAIRINLFNAYWLHDAPPVQYSTILHFANTLFMCFVFISEQTAISAPYDIN
jgi:hypothetical protein